MGKECAMLEVLKVPVEKEEEKGDEFELSLELSIGGRYGKSENSRGKTWDPCEENVKGQNNNCGISRSDFSCGVGDVRAENGCESMDLQRRREIQALRRQEARKKREEKLKKSRGLNRVGFVEDKLFLEAQKFQGRVQDREIRERDVFAEETARKKDKNGTNEVANDLNLSLFTENKIPSQQIERDCLYPKVQYLAPGNGFAYPCGGVPSWGPNVGEGQKNEGNVFRPVACRSSGAYRSGNSSMDCDSEHSNGLNDRGNWKTVSNRSLEQSSSAVSDYQSTSHKGGSSSDTGSHSSPSRTRQHHSIPRNALDHVESNGSSTQTELDQGLGGVPEHRTKVASLSNPHSSSSRFTDKSKPDTYFYQTNNTCSTSENRASPPLKETSGGLNDKAPKLPNDNLNVAASVPHMPCVSATGNGPNGKTITGFLYKYTKTEVSIMCVCHGSSFSPAEFVEHAGGVDISHPLRHITIVPSAFG
ncbi:hypothetical protein Pfo_018507 [Paulownia fortunei]|nr:hypothetical protein Pfo_018507 [Paulownia fortunei]